MHNYLLAQDRDTDQDPDPDHADAGVQDPITRGEDDQFHKAQTRADHGQDRALVYAHGEEAENELQFKLQLRQQVNS